MIKIRYLQRKPRKSPNYFINDKNSEFQIDADCSVDEARKKYKKLSLLIHPDKNPDNREGAEQAFDFLKKAIATVEDPDEVFMIFTFFEGKKCIFQLINSF
jgi:DnaJ family protein C protein 8